MKRREKTFRRYDWVVLPVHMGATYCINACTLVRMSSYVLSQGLPSFAKQGLVLITGERCMGQAREQETGAHTFALASLIYSINLVPLATARTR